MRRAWIRVLAALLLFSAAGVAGYLVSTNLGREALRGEAERQLGRLLRGEVSIERLRVQLRPGLVLLGERVEVAYPGREAPPFTAQHVTADIDTLSLLLGRFRLDGLRVEGLELHIERASDGTWSPPFVDVLRQRAEADAPAEPTGLEPFHGILRGCEAVARTLLDEAIVAHDVELVGGLVTLRDEGSGAPIPAPVELRAESLTGHLVHSWLPRDASLALTGRIVDGLGHRAALEAVGSRRGDQARALHVSLSDFDLSSLHAYVAAIDPSSDFDGRFSGTFAYATRDHDAGALDLHWQIEDLVCALPFSESGVRLDTPRASIDARLEIHPGRMRLAHARLAAGEVAWSFAGYTELPLRPSSRARMQAEVAEVGVPQLRRVVAALPAEDARPLEKLLERVRSGRITRLAASGTTQLSTWQPLLAGERDDLPEGFVLTADLYDVDVDTDGRDTLDDLNARVEWNGDVIAFRGARALWNDELLPRLDVTIAGISALLSRPRAERTLRADASPLPGLDALFELLESGGEAEPEPRQAVHVEVEELHHPIVRWPVQDAKLRIVPEADALRIDVDEMLWAGAPARGSLVFVRGAEPRVQVAVEVDAAPVAEPADAPRLEEDTWSAGRFSSAGLRGGILRFERVRGEYALVGAELRLFDIEADLAGGGVLNGLAEIELDTKGEVDLEAAFDVRDAPVPLIAPAIGLPAELATGHANFQSRVAGVLRPDAPIFPALTGDVHLQARDGEVRQSVPLLAALAHASEAFNPFAASEVLQYQHIDAGIEFENGTVRSDHVALDGPLRVLASGAIATVADESSGDAARIDAVVGLFLLRHADRLLGEVPLVNLLLPGSDRGLLGAYFEVSGSLADPDVRAMPIKSLTGGVPLPTVLRTPLEALGKLVTGDGKKTRAPTPEAPEPEPLEATPEPEVTTP